MRTGTPSSSSDNSISVPKISNRSDSKMAERIESCDGISGDAGFSLDIELCKKEFRLLDKEDNGQLNSSEMSGLAEKIFETLSKESKNEEWKAVSKKDFVDNFLHSDSSNLVTPENLINRVQEVFRKAHRASDHQVDAENVKTSAGTIASGEGTQFSKVTEQTNDIPAVNTIQPHSCNVEGDGIVQQDTNTVTSLLADAGVVESRRGEEETQTLYESAVSSESPGSKSQNGDLTEEVGYTGDKQADTENIAAPGCTTHVSNAKGSSSGTAVPLKSVSNTKRQTGTSEKSQAAKIASENKKKASKAASPQAERNSEDIEADVDQVESKETKAKPAGNSRASLGPTESFLERSNQMLKKKKRLAEEKEEREKEELRALSTVRFVSEASRKILEKRGQGGSSGECAAAATPRGPGAENATAAAQQAPPEGSIPAVQPSEGAVAQEGEAAVPTPRVTKPVKATRQSLSGLSSEKEKKKVAANEQDEPAAVKEEGSNKVVDAGSVKSSEHVSHSSGGVVERSNLLLEKKKRLAEQKEEREQEELRAMQAVRFVSEGSRKILELHGDTANVVERTNQLLEKKKRLQEEREERAKEEVRAMSAGPKMDKKSRQILERRSQHAGSPGDVNTSPGGEPANGAAPEEGAAAGQGKEGSTVETVNHSKERVTEHKDKGVRQSLSGAVTDRPSSAARKEKRASAGPEEHSHTPAPARPSSASKQPVAKASSKAATAAGGEDRGGNKPSVSGNGCAAKVTGNKQDLVARLRAAEQEVMQLRDVCLSALSPSDKPAEAGAMSAGDVGASTKDVMAFAAKYSDKILKVLCLRMPLEEAKALLINHIQNSQVVTDAPADASKPIVTADAKPEAETTAAH